MSEKSGESDREESSQTPPSPSEAPPMTDNSSPESEDQLSAEDLEEGVAAAQEEEPMAAEKSPAPVKNETEAGTNVDANKDNENNNKSLLETGLEEGGGAAVLKSNNSSNNSSMPGAFAVNSPFFNGQEDNNLEEADLTTDSPVDPSNNNSSNINSSNNPDEGFPQGLPVASKSSVVIALPMEIPEAAPSESTNKNRCMKIFLAVVLFLILMVAILIGVNISNGKENNLAEAGTDDLESNDELDDKTKTLEERYSAMIDLLAPLSGGPGVFDPQHPSASLDRISALRWIVEEDTAQFPIPETAITTSDEDYDEVWKLRQRYVLALFYYATDGENWKNSYQFLSSFDVCRWSTAWIGAYEETPVTDIQWPAPPVVTLGAICDQDDRVTILNLYWNNLGGTIPDEISIWSDTMFEMNLGGGMISGTLPSSLVNFTKLDSVVLNDNCLTGSIPDLHEIASLNIVSLNNNANQLTGSFNDKFCSSPTNTSLREGAVIWAADSENACSCCFNCDPDRLECTEPTGQFTWKNLNMGDLDALKSQFEKKCATPELKKWILNECPCVINVSTDLEAFPFVGECDTNCTDPERSYVYDGYP